MSRQRHKLTLWDRMRGWHWAQEIWTDHDGTYVGSIHVKIRNWCGCRIST